jgi:hypothetical protein
VFAIAIMATGLLSLAAVFSYGLVHLNTGNDLLIAKEKATEAIESVFVSRDSLVITWAQVRNASQGGIFLDGAQPIRFAGPDGLANTSDDGAVEEIVLPGDDGVVGTQDDQVQSLHSFSRQIHITDINPNLRQIRVIVTYPYGDGSREYELTTYISAFA